jgi:Terminase DNA packaging enzyme
MSNFEKSMEQIFDVAPIQKIQELVPADKPETLPAVSPEDLKVDLADAYEQTKSNLQDLIDQGKEAMNEILQIAKDGQHPRAFEVYGTLLKNVVDANKELLSVQKQMRDIDSKKSNGNGTNIDKAIFVGSTSELSKLIKGKE